MMKSAKLIETDSYFNIFNILKEQIRLLPDGIDDRTIIFCEEKISLLVESTLCNELNGSFSSRVFSFGNYLRFHSSEKNTLTREGSVMAIRKLLKTLPLKCFSRSKKGIASSVYNLFVLLKSAKITPSDIEKSLPFTEGVLKNKLEDIFVIFSAYEKFLSDSGLEDQNSVLTSLPELFEKDEKMANTDIILVGYTSLTRQAVSAIETLLKRAKSVTAIFTAGENKYSFVNEVPAIFGKVCEKSGVVLEKVKVPTDYNQSAKLIMENLFNPSAFNLEPIDSDKVYNLNASSNLDEIEQVGETIKALVLRGYRYRDFSIAFPNCEAEQFNVKQVFEKLDIPYFIDVKKGAENTALTSLILSYIEVFRRNMERDCVCDFVKNPLFLPDKELSDSFENYLIRYNINYSLIKKPFTLSVRGENLSELNKVREKLCDIFSEFNVRKMLETLDVETKQEELTAKLKELGFAVNGAVNGQIYKAVTDILDEMDMLLGSDVSISDVKETFISGINALEISVLPQYKDAVFIGDYRETALLQNKYIFALDLTSDVPTVKEDVAILCDSDIDKLEKIKVLIEPKVKIVNHRNRESIAMALSAFTERLVLCCPLSNDSGKNLLKSEVFLFTEKMFKEKEYGFSDGYLTKKQGLYTFGKDCTMFADGRTDEFGKASDFYYAVKPDEVVGKILEESNREISPAILSNKPLIGNTTSATMLEEYSKCPYRAFLRSYLHVSERDKGEVDPLSVGNVIHEVFEKYVKRLDEVKGREDSDRIAEEIFDEIIHREEYLKYLADEKENQTLKRTLEEAKRFCYNIFNQFVSSKFRPLYVEKKFGDGKEGSLPPVKLLGGKVNVKGKIDRVDGYKNYLRVIDYKTGSVDVKKDLLFYGSKLQLYLYSGVFKDSEVVGSYYMPVYSGFESEKEKEEGVMFEGDSLGDKEVLSYQDENYPEEGKSRILSAKIKGDKVEKGYTREELSAFSKYALGISDRIAKNMTEGFIPASPLEGECAYCGFRDVCDSCYMGERKKYTVNDDTIISAKDEEEK